MSDLTRRDLLRGVALLGLGSAAGAAAVSAERDDTVWQNMAQRTKHGGR